MKFSKLKKVGAICLVTCVVFMISCGKNGEQSKKVDGVKLNKGSVIQNIDGNYINLNFNEGKYTKVNSEYSIGLYDYESNNYVYQSEGKYYSFYDGNLKELKSIEIEDTKISLSPLGKYISLFRSDENEILMPHIISLKDGKEVDFSPKVGFSWRDIDWLDDHTLVYYGVDENRVNGVFTYDLDTNNEELLVSLVGGVQFIKSVNDGVIFLQETIDDKKILKEINKDEKKEKIISEELVEIVDIIKVNNGYYVLGKKSDSNFSVFKVNNGLITRMVYDFPKAIKVERGLSEDINGNILFVGIEEGDISRIYKCQDDGTISKVSDLGNEYSFVGRVVR